MPIDYNIVANPTKGSNFKFTTGALTVLIGGTKDLTDGERNKGLVILSMKNMFVSEFDWILP